jgi:tetratricopeptide (TPR) repeat protein
MQRQILNPCETGGFCSVFRFLTLVVVFFLLLPPHAVASPQTSSATAPRVYVPPELQVADPNVKALLDSADKSATLGNYGECLSFLQLALKLATKQKSLADRAVVEDTLAVYYFQQGRLEEAKSQWLNSLSDGVAVSNLVLQADVLVALSALSQQGGDLDQSLKGANQAVELAKRSKNFYIESRALGESGRLQLLAGKTADARASVEEALKIDRANKYNWEAGHLLYMAWVTASESKLDEAIELAASARDLAVKNSNYITFMQASFFLGNAYVHSSRASEGIGILERVRNGISEQGKPLFQSPEGYTKTAALPFFKISCVEALAMGYAALNRTDDALKAWQELYDTAAAAGFTVAKAESARSLGDLYRAKKEYERAADFYELAAAEWASAGNQQRRIDALNIEAPLLSQMGKKDKALQVDEELLPLLKASKDVPAQFLTDLVIAEILDGTGKLDRVEGALKDAESLVDSDLAVANVKPSLIVELYFRLAAMYEARNDVQQQLIALEKAITPASALASGSGDVKNDKPLSWLLPQLEAIIIQRHIREAGETAYSGGHLGTALVSFEILQYFEECDAMWRGKGEEYRKALNNDPTLARLLEIPAKIVSQDDGPSVLAKNSVDMGPIASRVRPLSLGLLTSYYMSHQRLDMVVKFARQALSLKGWDSEIAGPWGVAMSCELAYALMMEKDFKSAVDAETQCMAGAKRLGIPQLLQSAHQTNVWVLDAAGKHDEAQESVQFLLKQTPDDPLGYVQLAQMKTQQEDRTAAADAWRKAIQLFEARNNLSGAADAHLALANVLTFGAGADFEERRVHLEAADELYRQLGSSVGRVNAGASLGVYYAARKNDAKSREYFEGALRIARDAKRKDLEAYVLSQIGQAYETSDDLSPANEYYRKSADLYHQQNDPADEAFQLRNVSKVLNSLHRPEEALQSILKAKAAADRSNSWSARYWVRRTLAALYGNQGQYQDGVSVLKEAQQISDDANQPLSSAWAGLDLAAGLETIGSWQEASEQIASAIPVLEQFKDTDDETAAYIELMAIYGARESDLKDLDKALHFYQMVYQLVAKTHPDRAAALNLDLTEIYWDQGRFKDAGAKASEALDYYKKLKDELGVASALISLAEAQRSNGDLTDAATNLQIAEPLVDRANNFYTLGRFYYGRAGLYRAQGRLNDAIREYERVIKMLEQFKSTSDQENRQHVAEHYDFIYDELIEAYYALAQSDKQHAELPADKAFEYAELNKARAFSSSWGHAFVDGLRHQVPVALQDKEATLANEREVLVSELQKAMMGPGKHSAKKIEERLAKLGSAESGLEDQLRRTSPAYAEVRYPRRMNIEQVPLRPGELLVQLKMLNQATLVWLFLGTEQGTRLTAFYKVVLPRQWFADRVYRIRDAFNGGHPERFDSKITDELLGALFPDSVLQNVRDAKAIIFVPDDILFLLPFEMLSSHGQFLLLGTPTEYFPSSAALRLARTSIHATGSWPKSFIGIADPVTSSDDPRYQAVSLVSDPGANGPGQPSRSGSLDRIAARGFSLERLPGTAVEVRGIASLFATTPAETETRMGIDATKQELLRTDLAQFRFIHFATHGILPVESGIKEPALVLSYDGKGRDDMLLTLSEILKLKLHADMVTLSACNTGSGKVTRAEGLPAWGVRSLPLARQA